MGRAIGIDLGTTYSAMAFIEGGEPEIIPNAEGERTTPSVVALKDGELLVGSLAKRQMAINPMNTFFGVKRFMGRRFSEDKVQDLASRMPYAIKRDGSDGVAVSSADGDTYRPEEIAARILAKLKADAETFLGEEVTEAAITVPAYFDSDQREATKAAGEIAGLNVLRVISEPTAAALAYGLSSSKAADPASGKDAAADIMSGRTIAVYDLGGGTFDCSILKVRDGVFDAIATSGDPFLGGEDIDLLLADHVIKAFENAEGVNLANDPTAFARVKEACEIAKRDLSGRMSTGATLPFIHQQSSLDEQITRDELEGMMADLIARTIDVCSDALREANFGPSEIDEVLLVGGQTRAPAVVRVVEEFFGRPPMQSISPDEVVALGAAIQTGVLRDEITTDVLLLDVTAVTLGTDAIIDGVKDSFSPIIPRNTTIPTRNTEHYFTASDNQSQVRIDVLQGEEPLAADNKKLGSFILAGIKRGPAGQPVDVTFEIDADGIIHAKAVDPETEAENEISISNATSLTEKQIAEMAKRAEEEVPAH